MSNDLIYVQLESQNEKRENREEELFEEMMAKTFLKLMNNNKPTNTCTPRHIMIKVLNIFKKKKEETILGTSRDERNTTNTGIKVRVKQTSGQK